MRLCLWDFNWFSCVNCWLRPASFPLRFDEDISGGSHCFSTELNMRNNSAARNLLLDKIAVRIHTSRSTLCTLGHQGFFAIPKIMFSWNLNKFTLNVCERERDDRLGSEIEKCASQQTLCGFFSSLLLMLWGEFVSDKLDPLKSFVVNLRKFSSNFYWKFQMISWRDVIYKFPHLKLK